MVIWSYSYAPHSYTIFPSFETSSKMSLKKAIFDKNVLFKGHLITTHSEDTKQLEEHLAAPKEKPSQLLAECEQETGRRSTISRTAIAPEI
jgi:hypothetical protein